MDLSRADRSERLDRLAAEFALGTLPSRPRARLAQAARTEPVVAAAIGEWEQRLAALAAAIPAVTPPPRVWTAIASRLGLSAASTSGADDRWWNRLGVWRTLTAFAFVAALGFAIALLSQRAAVPEASVVAVLAGADGKPALIASARRNDAFLLVKAVGAAPVEAGKALELWILPTGAAPRSLGLIPATGVARVPLPAPTDSALANIPALAVSLEPATGSPTGLPTGPVLYSGPIERMY